jgi:hypothetical protein
VDDIGLPILVNRALIGLSMNSKLRPMPLVTDDPGAKKRYSKIQLRIIGSTIPIINGTRPATRQSITDMGTTQPPSALSQPQVANLGWTGMEIFSIEENLPLKSEILGIFGKLTTNST